MTSPLVYVAGPLFDEGERWWIETIDTRIAAHGLATFLPHRDNPDKTPDNTLEIFRNDRDAIDRCDLVVANLNGITTDDGIRDCLLSRGLGDVYKRQGLFTDWRRRFADEVVNLMIEHSVERIVRSLEELDGVLQSRFGA